MALTLTPSQRAALSGDRNIMVLAGAGTGKTRALTERVHYLITQKSIRPSELLVLTFTRKAASEMKERIYNRLIMAHFKHPEDKHLEQAVHQFNEMTINTFHGFFASLLRDYGHKIGLHHQFKVMEEELDVQTVGEQVFLKVIQQWSKEYPEQLTTLFTYYDYDELKGVTDAIIRNWLIFSDTLRFYEEMKVFRDGEIDYELFKRVFAIKPDLDYAALEALFREFLNDTMNIVLENSQSKSKILAALRDAIPLLMSEMNKAPDTEARIGIFYKMLSELDVNGEKKSLFKKDDKLFSKGSIPNRLKEVFDWYNDRLVRFLNQYSLTPVQMHDFFTRTIDENEFKHYIQILSIWLNWGKDAIEHYQAAKREGKTVDFHDLEAFCKQLFETNPEVVRKLREKYKYVMVDEFQDTNSIQWDLLWHIVSEDEQLAEKKLFIVGDKKQAIYGFRGGEVEMCDVAERIIRNTNQLYGKTSIPLETVPDEEGNENFKEGIIPFMDNFRSHPALLEFFNTFGNILFPDTNPEPFDTFYQPLVSGKKMESTDNPCVYFGFYSLKRQEDTGEEVELRSKEKKELEANHLARFLRLVLDGNWAESGRMMHMSPEEAYDRWNWLHQSMKQGKKSVGILFRRKTHMAVFENALVEYNLPFKMESGQSLFEQQEIRDILHLLRWLKDPTDDTSLVGFARSVIWGLSDLFIMLLSLIQSPHGNSFFRKMKSLYELLPKADQLVSVELVSLKEVFRDQWSEFLELVPQSIRLNELEQLEFPAADWYRFRIGFEHLFSLNEQMFKLPLFSLFLEVIKRFQIMELYKRFPDGEQRLANIREFMELLNGFVIDHSQADLFSFLEHVKLLEKGDVAGLGETDDEAVIQVMTVHKSKGLEFPLVILVDLDSESSGSAFKKRDILLLDKMVFQSPWKDRHGWEFPNLNQYIPEQYEKECRFPLILPRSRKISDDNFYYPLEEYVFIKDVFREYAEERRLLYVAMTRAEKGLMIISGIESPLHVEQKDVVNTILSWDKILQQCFTDISLQENVFSLRDEFRELPILCYQIEHHEPEDTRFDAGKELRDEEIVQIPESEIYRIIHPSELGEEVTYERGEYSFSIPETEFGTIVHELMEKKVWNQSDEKVMAMAWTQQPVLKEEELKEIVRHVKTGGQIIEQYLKEYPEMHVEVPFVSTLDSDRKIFLKGVMDVLLLNPESRKAVILDYKTNFIENPDKVYAAQHGYDKQLAGYCEFVSKTLNVKVEKAVLIFTFSGKTIEYSQSEWKNIFRELVNKF